jgi:hypothetical protein
MGQNHCCRKFGPESLGVGSNLSCWTCWTNLVRNFVSVWLLAWRLSGIWIFSLSFVLSFFVWFGYARIFCFLLGLSIVSSMSFCRSRKWCFFFFEKHSTNSSAHIHAHTLNPMNARTHTLSLLWSSGLSLEIDEVTTGALLLMETSPPTERIFCLMRHIDVKPRVWTLLGVQPPS